ncbi:transcription initiation factor TFIID subunit 14 [Striga asiatica]|uniref:Transcription initiation factor TFIID subunit 14 n=1 Tax=Striga asiatica TaxID=4170 RepID=A0A5A7QYY2_STRAF|nr:transcription initiation factor TFIID subunit 14 [Striga asiatica]
MHLFHHLKLYPEEESGLGPLSTKKPVIVESYDEIVLSAPFEAFFALVQNHPAVIVPRLPVSFTLPLVDDFEKKNSGDTKNHSLNQWFTNFSEVDVLLKLATARQQVQSHIARLRRQLSLIDGQNQQLKAAPDM